MVIYEVNLSVDNDIYPIYETWLTGHIHQMLSFKGFKSAKILENIEVQDTKQSNITVVYEVEAKTDLDNYLKEHAPKMRQEGIDKFKDKFSASRRIFNIKEFINK